MHSFEPSELDRLILDSAQEANILPISSRCASGCVFCSHKNNPHGVAVHSVGVRSLDDITRTLAFLDPGRVITIGESATTIVEGEPLAHPDFRAIIALVRRAFPGTPLEITTNGSYLDGDNVEFLARIGNLTLNVSLNSASVRGRRLLMGDAPDRAERTFEGVGLLRPAGLRFSGSLVALPNLVGWDDVRDTALFLAGNGATAVRVIWPAFSRLADARLLAETKDLYSDLRRFVDGLPDDLPCPVLLEPSAPADLAPVVTGVLADSPARRAGVRRGDVLASVNGRRPRCRVEAWQWLLPAGAVTVEVERAGATRTVTWTNGTEGSAGVTMEYDFDPLRIERLGEAISAGTGRALLLASELGYPVVCRVLELLGVTSDVAEALAVKNATFGGTVAAAGLLTVDDYLPAFRGWAAAGPGGAAAARIIVPHESFDRHGFDLLRCHYSRLEEETGASVSLVRCCT